LIHAETIHQLTRAQQAATYLPPIVLALAVAVTPPLFDPDMVTAAAVVGALLAFVLAYALGRRDHWRLAIEVGHAALRAMGWLSYVVVVGLLAYVGIMLQNTAVRWLPLAAAILMVVSPAIAIIKQDYDSLRVLDGLVSLIGMLVLASWMMVLLAF
jgi:vacuolar-type H+-ATPase subunit I/STV1